MKFIAKAVCGLVFLGSQAPCYVTAEEAEQANLRKLDVVFTQPTMAPTPRPTRVPTTRRPTRAPTPAPTPSPTVSNAPSVSFAPTFPEPPVCPALVSDEREFCYDGQGTQYGKYYTQCAATLDVQSGHCGEYDFLINGEYYGEFQRCGDPWRWFEACIESYGCTKHHRSGVFVGGDRKPRTAVWEGYDHKWRFQLWGNGMTSGRRIEWICNEQEQARGIQEFAKAMMNGKDNLFTAQEKPCVTPAPSDSPSEAPSLSHLPTSSPAPTETAAPMCPRGRFEHEYLGPKRGNYFRTTKDVGFGERFTFTVTDSCTYQIEGDGTERMDTMAAFLWRIGELYGGKVESSAELTSVAPIDSDIVQEDCGEDKYCAVIRGKAISDGAMISWSFYDRSQADRLRGFLNWMAKAKPEVWETNLDEDLKCGSGPYCFDQKTQTTCYVDPVSQNCGKVDFLIDGIDVDYERGSDVWPWFTACSQSFGCVRENGGTFTYGNPSRNVYQNWRNEQWYFRLSGNGVSGSIKWRCPDEEAAREMKAFADSVYNEGYFNMEPAVCTDAPTSSPTKAPCKDSLLTEPPLNIAVVIDMSYSTYETNFDGTAVGDLNGDGKADTILDAEIAAVLALLDIIATAPHLRNDNTDIGIIVFDTQASYKGTFAPEGHYKPLNDSNDAPNPQLVADLKALQTYTERADVAKYNTGFTNFDDALDKAILYFEDEDVETSGRNNVMVFLSDGLPNVRGDGDNEDWCENAKVDCASFNLSNKPITADTPSWEEGELSFCYQGDEECGSRPYHSCALGIESCQDTEMAKSFDSELKRLDDFNVFRLSVGVGSGSDNSYDSGLWRIDNNPWQEFGVLPKQVFTTDELSLALSELCIESTDAPTTSPSSAPTNVPSASPTKSPTTAPSALPTSTPTIFTTSSPTSKPTGTPTAAPSVTPTSSPTYSPGICDYNVLDFDNPYEEEGVLYLHPNEWRSYGLRVDASPGKFVAYAQDSEDHSVLVIDDYQREGIEPSEDGGEVVFTTDGDWEDAVEIVLSDLQAPATIQTLDRFEQEVQVIEVDPASLRHHRPRYQVPVEGVMYIVISFEGVGAIASFGICHEAQEIEMWEAYAPDFWETEGPTGSPTEASVSTCPVDLLTQIGDLNFDLPNTPVKVVQQAPDGSTVKIQVQNSWFDISTSATEAMYVSFEERSGDEQCLSVQEVTEEWTDEFVLHCVHHDYALVNIYVVDPGFAELMTSDYSASIPICCHPDEESSSPVVEYVFKVPCDCPDLFEIDVQLAPDADLPALQAEEPAGAGPQLERTAAAVGGGGGTITRTSGMVRGGLRS